MGSACAVEGVFILLLYMEFYISLFMMSDLDKSSTLACS